MSYIFIYGRPGTGKTTLACSMTKLGYKVNIIDTDQKAHNMQNLKHLFDGGKVVSTPIIEKLNEANMKQRILTPQIALAKQPKGYLAVCDIINTYEEEISAGKTRLDEVLVIDSLTSLVEHMKKLIGQTTKKEHFSFAEWGIVLSSLEGNLYDWMRLQKLFKHVIIIAHEQSEYDDEGRVVSILPSIEGSMRNKIMKFFEEGYRTIVDSRAGKVEYKVQTVPMNKAEARSSRELPPYEVADFSILFKEELK